MPSRPCRAVRALALATGAALALLALSAPPAVPAQEPGGRVVLAFLAADPEPRDVGDEDTPEDFRPVLERLRARPGLSIGLSSATQGRYDPVQALLDLTQGTRVSLSAYDPRDPPALRLAAEDGGARLAGWRGVVRRADSAPADVVPGLLAGAVPGGAGLVTSGGASRRPAIAAADRAGRIARSSAAGPGDVAARTRALLATRRFVVVTLPPERSGERALGALLAARDAGDLLIVMQAPPTSDRAQLLPVAIAGLGGAPGRLTSATTKLDGVIAGIDLAPTVLRHLDVPVPDDVTGEPIEVVPGRDAGALADLADRLRVVLPRRLPALWSLLGAWLILLLAATLIADRRGLRWAMRVGALAVMWVPAAVLVAAALAPARGAELLLVAGLCLAAAALTDRLLPFPRGPALPALAGVAAYVVDLAFGSPLIIRSLLGPNPLFGSRFYGIGNELEAALSALLLIGLGALLCGRGRSRAGVAAFAAGGLVLGVAIGAGRLGADVGGVITVAAGAATAAVLMLPGGVTRRAVAVVVGAPVAALVLLAIVDTASGGDSHFTRTVLRADDSGALLEVVGRRYELAGRQAVRGFMPVATVIAILAIALGVRRRERALAGVGGDPAYRGALAGVIAVGVAGALFNDSGPVLLLFATFLGACAVAYLRGDPRLAAGAPSVPVSGGAAAPQPSPGLEAGLPAR